MLHYLWGLMLVMVTCAAWTGGVKFGQRHCPDLELDRWRAHNAGVGAYKLDPATGRVEFVWRDFGRARRIHRLEVGGANHVWMWVTGENLMGIEEFNRHFEVFAKQGSPRVNN